MYEKKKKTRYGSQGLDGVAMSAAATKSLIQGQ